MLLLLWFLNFGISIVNAVGCGTSWNETRSSGGFVHFMNWMGAIMASVGFTWCYMVIIGFVASHIPIEADDGTSAPLLSGEALKAFYDLGYLAIIAPALGSGLAITVNSWKVFSRSRSLGDGLAAGWNTFAQVHNTMGALEHVPSVTSSLGSFFDSKNSKDGRGTLVVILVAIAVFDGVLTTWGIISMVSSRRRQPF